MRGDDREGGSGKETPVISAQLTSDGSETRGCARVERGLGRDEKRVKMCVRIG